MVVFSVKECRHQSTCFNACSDVTVQGARRKKAPIGLRFREFDKSISPKFPFIKSVYVINFIKFYIKYYSISQFSKLDG